mgnify:CR=1 FL=1
MARPSSIDETELRTLWSYGLECGEIARRLNVSRNAARRQMIRLGIYERVPEAHERQVEVVNMQMPASPPPVPRHGSMPLSAVGTYCRACQSTTARPCRAKWCRHPWRNK